MKEAKKSLSEIGTRVLISDRPFYKCQEQGV